MRSKSCFFLSTDHFVLKIHVVFLDNGNYLRVNIMPDFVVTQVALKPCCFCCF